MLPSRVVIAIGLLVGLAAGPAAYAGMTGDVSCKEAKARAAAKQAADVLKAHMRNQRTPSEVRLADDISKSESKFERALARAESSGYCSTVGDSEAIGAKVDTFVVGVLSVISPICGDGVLGPGEECDAPDDGACPGHCRAGCTCEACGVGGTWPTCGGGCPSTETCGDIGFGCGCIPAGEPSCGGSFPACGGACPEGQTCITNGFLGCVCVIEEYEPCGDALAPACDGACRPGLFCVDSQDTCACLPIGGMQPCGSIEGPPTCFGECPSDAPVCRDVGGACTCTAWPSGAFLDATG